MSASNNESKINDQELLHETDLGLREQRENTEYHQRQIISNSIKTTSDRIIEVIKPVIIGCLYTCILIRVLSLNSKYGEQILGKTFTQLGVDLGSDGQSPGIGSIFTIVVIVCLIIIALTLVILLIFYLEWHKCLSYYLYIPCLVTLAVITPLMIHHILRAINSLAMDMFTMAIFIWNFTVFGLVSIFGLLGVKSPLLSQQFFLIHNSSMLAILIIEILPSWAPWLLLVFMILWDLFAVLAPIGPLNLILNMAEKRGVVEMPGIVYSTQVPPSSPGAKSKEQQEKIEKQDELQSRFKELKVENLIAKDTPDAPCNLNPSITSSAHDDETPNSPQPPATINSDAEPQAESLRTPTRTPTSPRPNGVQTDLIDIDEEEGTSIGIGDFVFYSLLVGLTSRGDDIQDYYTSLATLVSVQFGLVLTLVILSVTNRPLPAVPISVAIGLTIAYLTTSHVPEFANKLASQTIFI